MKQFNYSYEERLNKTRQRLREWGAWYNAILSMGLNFSSKSIVGKLIDAKGLLIQGTGEHLAPDNQRAEEIDQLVNTLAKENEKAAKILCYHYTAEGNKSERVQQSGIAKRTYYDNLLYGEKWVSSYL